MEIRMNKSAFLLPIILLFGCNTVHAPKTPISVSVYSQPKTRDYSTHDMLKNWALSRCIGAITKDEETRKDAYSTASAYFEFAVYPLETFEDLDMLVKKYVDQKYSGSIPSEFNTMKCIDMFHSQELEKLVDDWIKK
jgi:hypothetical protein